MAQISDAIEMHLSESSPADDVYVFPASFAQQRLWFLDQFEPGSPFYNIPLAIRLQGRLDSAMLHRALIEIVRRHEILRTTFAALDGQPVQLITPVEALGADPLPLPVTDLSRLPGDQREAEMQRLATWEAQRPFDLRAGPLVRAALLRLADDDHLALLTLHHIIADGWSMGVLMHEIAALYAAFAAGRPSPLPDLPLQYADYAVWQRETLSRSDGGGAAPLERQLAYWRQRLADAPAALDLPTDRPRPPVQSSRGASVNARLPRALVEQVRALSRQAGATLFMTLEAAFATLLSRYSGQTDLCIGTPVAGRRRPELEGLIGCFINTLVLRHNLGGGPSFRGLLAQVRETALEAFAHQDVPFEWLVEEVQAARDISRTPLFQVMFILQNAPAPVHRLPGLTLTQLDVETGTSTFDLTLSAAEDGDGIALAAEYCTDLFEATTIERLLEHYRVVLEGIVADPDCPIDRLPLLTAGERSTLLAWGGATHPLPAPGGTVVERFEAEAARTPDAEAVVWGATRLAYADLDRRANQLAHYLRGLGVQPGTLVGIAVERSAELIVAVLGTLKAGGAYLPLDPAYPPERLAWMLADARPAVVLTGAGDLPAWLRNGNQRVVNLMAEADMIAACPQERLAHGATLDDLAYVIYTSGSTGPAKGVMVTHAALANAYAAWERAYELRGAVRRHVQMASFSFDVFAGDLVRALCSGGALVLCPRETLLEPARLYELLRQERIDCAEFVPGVLRLLMEYLNTSGERLDWMRLVICGSDAWFVGEYRRVQRLCGANTRIINSFGLTETTIDSTYFDGGVGGLLDEQSVPIGRPFDGVCLFILDQQRQLAPIGVPGELYISGAGVARGYLNRPDLTEERFVLLEGIGGDRDTAPVQRAYRTGDRARWLADGNIEFLGRLDHQVKIRGYRVEPGEIEATLVRHPAVRAAAVTFHADAPGGPRLAAYLEPVAADAAARDGLVADVRCWLQERLPEYMIPSAFVVVDALPLTPNGKIDRRALPAPDWSVRMADAAFVAPRTPVEETLATIWSDLLGVARIGAQDEFFALGGHSLLATQLVARIRAVCGVELPVRAVFETPRLADMAQRVEQLRRTDGRPAAPPIRPLPRDGRRFPLSFAQQRLWFLDQLEPDSPFYTIPEVVRLRGRLDLGALEKALNVVARRQEALRMRIVASDGQPALVIEPASILETRPLRIQVRDLRALPANERESAALRIAGDNVRQPFRLDQAPLMRALALRLADDDHLLVLAIHHIIGDAWSTNILVQEVTACYDALIAGRSPDLPDLPVQYADYAVWQREWLQGETLERQLSFWRERLGGLPPLLDLPTDRPRPAVQTFNGAYTTFRLPVRLSDALRALAQREGATLFMTLLTAFATLLRRYSGQEEFAIGVPVAGRSHAEVEGLIGFFVNTLALRMNLAGRPSFREALQRVRATALDAYAHQDVPFEMVVDALQPERTLSHSPIFQVMMVMQNDVSLGNTGRAGAGMETESVTIHSGAAKFDLTLFVIDDGAAIEGAFEYNTDLFDADRIARMIGHLHTLLEGVADNPDQTLDRLPLLTLEERQRLLVEWNATTAPFPADRCTHDLVLDQAARTPDAIAVESTTERLTYANLVARAAALAHCLRDIGVGPDALVAVAIPRSPDLLTALFGVWMAGGAYVPLDLRHPPARQRALLDDARPLALLTTATPGDHLAGPWRIIDMTALDMSDTSPPPTTSVTPDHLAYVLYTSGSTGAPKGVMVTHRGLVNYLTWCTQAYDVAAGRGALVHTPVTFDLTVTGLFAPLIAGRTVYLLPDDADLEDLAAALLAHDDLSLVKITPAHLEALQALIPPERAAGRTRAFIIGGENLRGETLRFWQRHAPQTRLVNEYGPTETVVGCCVYTAPPDETWRIVPIGRPIANTQLYVLDRYGQPVPVGVTGELYIGGAGVARGYLNRPDLTAERFVTLPELPEVEGRVYRSGDLVRYRADGALECLGRADYQVKIRGFRIELEEIEAHLAAHPAVAAAAVTVHEDGRGVKRLAAYVVPVNAGVPSAAELQAFLADRLPEYMLPSRYTPLPALPLTPNGKLDRAALPLPPADEQARHAEVQPLTPVEQALAAIWADVLGVAQVGRDDNFFALGGDSILSIQVVARARQAGIQLKARDLFQARTLAELARLAESAAPLTAEQGMVTGVVPLTPIQRWFFEQNLPNPHHWNQAALLALPEALDPAALAAAVQALLAQHDMLRARFVRSDDGWRQIIAPPDGKPPVWQRDLAAVDDAALAAAITRECAAAQASLNLERGPVIRVVHLDLGAGRGARLLLAVHHLVIDAVSWGPILDDLQTAYAQARAAQPIRLPPKTSSFKAWAERLAAEASSDTTRAEIDDWKAVIRPPAAQLPLDRTGANIEADAQRISVALDAEETGLLLEVAARARIEVIELLLAALARATGAWAGGSAILIDVERHGREDLFEDIDVSRTVGWFTTIAPLRVEYEPGEAPVDTLRRVHRQTSILPRHGIGYGLLRDQLAINRASADVCINYYGSMDRGASGNSLPVIATDERGPDRDPAAPRPYLIEIDGGIVEDRLHLEWTYSQALHRETTMAQVTQTFLVELRAVMHACRQEPVDALETVGVAEFGWDEEDLNAILAELDRHHRSSS